MRFWVVTALRYIKSEEITPVELMTANELGSQLTPSATSSRWVVRPEADVDYPDQLIASKLRSMGRWAERASAPS